MKYAFLLLLIPLALTSCATYNNREYAEVYNTEYRHFVARPFHDMVEYANRPGAQGYGMDGKDVMKAMTKMRAGKQEPTFVNEGISINLGE